MTSTVTETAVAPGGATPRWTQARSRLRQPTLFLLSSLIGLVFGGLIIALTGHNPIDAYRGLADGALVGPGFSNLQYTIDQAIPVVGMGLATAIAFRAGFFNLGGEGQLVLGGLTAVLVALYLPLPAPFLMPAALVCAALVAGLYASFAAFLQFELAVPLLVSTLILNYPAEYFATYLVVHRFRDIATGLPETNLVPDAARLPVLNLGIQIHAGILILIALLALVTFFMRRTTLGFEMNMTGLNPRFARYGGVSIRRLGYTAMAASGGVAGLIGGIVVLADFGRYVNGGLTDPLYAWTGLMAALLAGSAPLGVAIVGLFFAALQTGALGMEQATDVPHELSQVLQGIIILLIVARTTFGSSAAQAGRDSS